MTSDDSKEKRTELPDRNGKNTLRPEQVTEKADWRQTWTELAGSASWAAQPKSDDSAD